MKIQIIKKQLIRSTIFSGLLAIAFFVVGFVAVQAHDDDEDCQSKECHAALVNAKQATAKYHDVQVALNDGFINTRQCVQHPTLGAMGIHFVKPPRIANPAVAVEEPETLLYIPETDGSLRLVGLEYVVPAPLTPTAPVLFGQTFHFNPMRNEYALHVWAWRNNPSGMFADFNPKLSCP